MPVAVPVPWAARKTMSRGSPGRLRLLALALVLLCAAPVPAFRLEEEEEDLEDAGAAFDLQRAQAEDAAEQQRQDLDGAADSAEWDFSLANGMSLLWASPISRVRTQQTCPRAKRPSLQ